MRSFQSPSRSINFGRAFTNGVLKITAKKSGFPKKAAQEIWGTD